MKIFFITPLVVGTLAAACSAQCCSSGGAYGRPACCPCPNPIYCSPVFHMPLQPAPSVADGGYYVLGWDGRLTGPYWFLVPPFTPIRGFNGTEKGQEIFVMLMKEQFKPKDKQPPRGLGNYDMDFTRSQHPYGPGMSMPMPGFRPGGMPYAPPGTGFAPPPGYGPPPGMGPGFGPPQETGPKSLIAQAPYGAMNGIQLAQAVQPQQRWVANYPTGPAGTPNYSAAVPNVGYAPPSWYSATPNVGYANGYGYAANNGYAPPYMPAPGTPNYVPQYPNTPNYGYAPTYVPLPNTPTVPTPPGLPTPPSVGYAPTQVPLPAYGYTPNMPNYSYTPNLPAVAYEPPLPPATTAVYPSHSLIRSPRDFFMWGETMEDQAARERRPALVP